MVKIAQHKYSINSNIPIKNAGNFPNVTRAIPYVPPENGNVAVISERHKQRQKYPDPMKMIAPKYS